jgi:hypothetical protein
MKKISLLIILLNIFSHVLCDEEQQNSQIKTDDPVTAQNNQTDQTADDVTKLADPTQNITPPPAKQLPALQAIAKNSYTAFCVIDNQILGLNDEIYEFKVAKIAHDYVLLIDNNNLKLKLKIY